MGHTIANHTIIKAVKKRWSLGTTAFLFACFFIVSGHFFILFVQTFTGCLDQLEALRSKRFSDLNIILESFLGQIGSGGSQFVKSGHQGRFMHGLVGHHLVQVKLSHLNSADS